jgi:hypothetical protein
VAVLLQHFVKLILQFAQQSTVLEFCVCVDRHASTAIQRANCVVQTQQFFFQRRVDSKEFDIEVADPAEDLIVRIARDNAGFPIALWGQRSDSMERSERGDRTAMTVVGSTGASTRGALSKTWKWAPFTWCQWMWDSLRWRFEIPSMVAFWQMQWRSPVSEILVVLMREREGSVQFEITSGSWWEVVVVREECVTGSNHHFGDWCALFLSQGRSENVDFVFATINKLIDRVEGWTNGTFHCYTKLVGFTSDPQRLLIAVYTLLMTTEMRYLWCNGDGRDRVLVS